MLFVMRSIPVVVVGVPALLFPPVVLIMSESLPNSSGLTRVLRRRRVAYFSILRNFKASRSSEVELLYASWLEGEPSALKNSWLRLNLALVVDSDRDSNSAPRGRRGVVALVHVRSALGKLSIEDLLSDPLPLRESLLRMDLIGFFSSVLLFVEGINLREAGVRIRL